MSIQPDEPHRSSSAQAAQDQLTDQEGAILQLPTDVPKTPTTPHTSGYYHFTLPNRVTAIFSQQAQQKESVDGRSLLLAAFNTLLYRYTQQQTLAFPLHQVNVQFEQYAIDFQTQVQGDLTARQFIGQIDHALNNGPERSTELRSLQSNTSPVAVTLLDLSTATPDAERWIDRLVGENTGRSHLPDLHLIIVQQADAIAPVLHYNQQLFKPDTIQRLAGHVQVLVEAMLFQPDTPLARLPLLTPTEKHQLLVGWASERVEQPEIPIHQYIEAHAIQQPSAIAVTFNEASLTYAELNQRANQLAHYLNQIGIGSEDRVAVCVQPSLDIAVILLGIFKAGATYVPLDSTHPVERLLAILEDTRPQILLTQSAVLHCVPAIAPHTLCLDQEWDKLQDLPTHNPVHAIDLNQTAYLIYTSGTTGKPKGVMASHENLVNYILLAQQRFDFNRQDVMTAVARFTFSITMFELLSPLVAGGKLVILEREHILDFKRMVQTLEQVTVMHTSPSLMQKLLAYIQDSGIDRQRFQRLRHISTGGDMVPPDVLETMKAVFQNAEVFVIYGCSEVSCMGCTYPVPRERTVTKSLVGKPFNNVAVRLYDPHHNLVPIGVPGEIHFSGAGVTKGYLNREDLTQEKFVTIDGQRFYRTGDLGRFDSEGNLEILGRTDFQIKLRGIRIELGDIESTLRKAPGVREGVVMACVLSGSEKSLVAYVVLDQSQPPTIEAIRQFLQDKLPDYMVPAAFVILDAMPVNLNQKLDRRALPAPTLENLAGAKPIIAPRNDWETQLTKIWETALDIHPIGVQHNFFELGGNSLSAVQILTQIEAVMGKTLPITILLHAQTIEDLVKAMRATGEDGIVSDVVPLRSSGTKPPLFCLYGILIYQEMVNHLDPDQPVYGVFLQEEVELLKTGRFDAMNSVFSTVPRIATRYLEAIRSVQPHGPYYLAGESFGGVIAYEMAQQLQAEGEEVALVALLDSWMLNMPMPLVERLKAHWALLAKHKLSYAAQLLQKYTGKLQRRLSARFHKIHHLFQADVPEASTPSPVANKTAQENLRDEVLGRAGQSYQPKPYAGKMILFRAAERERFEVGTRGMGWESLAVQGLDIFEIPGNHLTILQEPNVRILANHLASYLDNGVSSQDALDINLGTDSSDQHDQPESARSHLNKRLALVGWPSH